MAIPSNDDDNVSFLPRVLIAQHGYAFKTEASRSAARELLGQVAGDKYNVWLTLSRLSPVGAFELILWATDDVAGKFDASLRAGMHVDVATCGAIHEELTRIANGGGPVVRVPAVDEIQTWLPDTKRAVIAWAALWPSPVEAMPPTPAVLLPPSDAVDVNGA